MEFSRQEYWSGLLFPSPGDLPDLGIELRSPALQTDSLPPELPGEPRNSISRTFFLRVLTWFFAICGVTGDQNERSKKS